MATRKHIIHGASEETDDCILFVNTLLLKAVDDASSRPGISCRAWVNGILDDEETLLPIIWNCLHDGIKTKFYMPAVLSESREPKTPYHWLSLSLETQGDIDKLMRGVDWSDPLTSIKILLSEDVIMDAHQFSYWTDVERACIDLKANYLLVDVMEDENFARLSGSEQWVANWLDWHSP